MCPACVCVCAFFLPPSPPPPPSIFGDTNHSWFSRLHLLPFICRNACCVRFVILCKFSFEAMNSQSPRPPPPPPLPGGGGGVATFSTFCCIELLSRTFSGLKTNRRMAACELFRDFAVDLPRPPFLTHTLVSTICTRRLISERNEAKAIFFLN